ncbi:nucleotidyltransferase [Desulfosporosinus fructosivorans]|uniref:Nucleotidyltransferase n=1 Tax=Desulfosporosinus fructosivorans TaxID=2018669 RepID=A0A4Z0R1R1_9FIRM|nr:nucleotidyltransferase [Desulfosporosinus fructosivorans]TGE36688.1 nucleotidyltransferase [Desulfosporosinus fructosivorans]
MLAQAFEDYASLLEIDNLEDIHGRFRRITKRLNSSFWESENDQNHGFIVGSLGRETAIKGVSDLDMLFVLPKEIKQQYDKHEGNGQSKLLQAVKAEIKKTYPRTIVRGDGQVVVVSFDSINYAIEVCPSFERSDGAFDFPDSNNDGTWKKTDPFPEIEVSIKINEETDGHYGKVCNIIRAWKNNWGFKFGGLLIDTLVYNFFDEYKEHKEATFSDYLNLFKDLFYYLKTRNADQTCWFALGSKQRIYNKKGKFVSKAKSAYDKIKDLAEDSEGLYNVLEEIFGQSFPNLEPVSECKIEKSSFAYKVRKTEEFIENKYLVDIRYSLKIDCEVTQPGFMMYSLKELLHKRLPLLANKSLKFLIVKNEFSEIGKRSEENLPYEVYWKILNRGEEAIRRDSIRGEIVRDKGKGEKVEKTSFKGEHYVECYIVHRGTVVARDRILVPIANTQLPFHERLA